MSLGRYDLIGCILDLAENVEHGQVIVGLLLFVIHRCRHLLYTRNCILQIWYVIMMLVKRSNM